MMKLEDELKIFIQEVRKRVDDSHLARLMERTIGTIERQRNELLAMHKENDGLRYRLVQAQKGLQDAKAAILSLTETKNDTQN